MSTQPVQEPTPGDAGVRNVSIARYVIGALLVFLLTVAVSALMFLLTIYGNYSELVAPDDKGQVKYQGTFSSFLFDGHALSQAEEIGRRTGWLGDYWGSMLAVGTSMASTILFFGALNMQRKELHLQRREIRHARDVAKAQAEELKWQTIQLTAQTAAMKTATDLMRQQLEPTKAIASQVEKQAASLSDIRELVRDDIHFTARRDQIQTVLAMATNAQWFRMHNERDAQMCMQAAIIQIVEFANCDRVTGLECLRLFAASCPWFTENLRVYLNNACSMPKYKKELVDRMFENSQCWLDRALQHIALLNEPSFQAAGGGAA